MTSRIDDLKQTDGQYDRKKDASGKWSANNGDFVIAITGHLSNYQIARIISELTGGMPEDYTAAYVHLNKGMERMNLNNKLRYTLLGKHKQMELDVNRAVAKYDKAAAKFFWDDNDVNAEALNDAYDHMQFTRQAAAQLKPVDEMLFNLIVKLNLVTAEQFYGDQQND